MNSMFNKNLKYYRLKKNLSKRELATLVDVSPMAITHYENGDRKPNMEIIKALARALDVRVTDFLSRRNEQLVFVHGEFRKNTKLGQAKQELIRESVEEYMSRFFSAVDILGGEVLPDAPKAHQLPLTGNVEADAAAMRRALHIAETGPVGNLIELLENIGVLVYVCSEEKENFFGMNGTVNGRPYIIVNGTMTPERIRSTIAHELAHFVFAWDETMEEKEAEALATAISGAFLFPKADAIREMGIRRSAITPDMKMICKEYGISMYLLTKRAEVCRIINSNAAKEFYIRAGQMGWKKNEPVRIMPEKATLFPQLVYRAVCEEEISVQRGAELLQVPYEDVVKACFEEEVADGVY